MNNHGFTRALLASLLVLFLNATLLAQPILPIEQVYRSAQEAAGSGRYEEALRLYQDCVVRTREEKGITYPVYKNSLLGMARCYEETGDDARSVAYYKKALDLIRVQYGPSSKQFDDCFSSLIGRLIARGDINQTVLALLEYLPPSNAELCRYWGEIVYMALITYSSTSQWAMVEKCVEKLREIMPHYSPPRMDNYYNMAIFSAIKTGRFLDAENYLSELKKSEDINQTAILHNELTTAILKGDFAYGTELAREQVSLNSKLYGKKSSEYAMALADYGTVLSSSGNYQQAVKELEKALDIYRQLWDSESDINASLEILPLVTLGSCYAMIGNTEKALASMEEAVHIAGALMGEGHEEYASAIENLASIKKIVGRTREAASDFATAYGIRREMAMRNFLLMDGNERLSYWEQSDGSIRRLYECCANLKDGPLNAKCYDAALFSKGLLLHSTIALQRFILESGDEEMISIFRDLQQKKSSLSLVPSAEDHSAEERKLLEKVSALGDYTQALGTSWEDVRGALSGKDVAIEFVTIGKEDSLSYGALVLKTDSEFPAFICLCDEKRLYRLMEQSANNLFVPGTAAEQLYSLIWEPLEAYLTEGCDVYFSPGGLLHQIAIESSPDRKGNRMQTRFRLHRVSSTREVCRRRAPEAYRSAALFGGLDYDATPEDLFRESFSEITDASFLQETSRGVADALAESGNARSWPALPGTKMEVEEISALMGLGGLEVSLYCGAKGTEDAFYTLSGRDYSIIHLATHGFFIPQAQAVGEFTTDYPSLGGQMLSEKRTSEASSGLVFAGGNNTRSNGDTLPGIGDGILSSGEVQALDFTRTDLVVLSACESGQGSLSGEELFGLQRGFKQAGAGSILMTLSRVDDEATALMMTSFYSALLAGASKHDAFIQAQDRTRERYPQPGYWTPFILLDD